MAIAATEADVGKPVYYVPEQMSELWERNKEYGVISAVHLLNNKWTGEVETTFVFVKFGDAVVSKLCAQERLWWDGEGQ